LFNNSDWVELLRNSADKFIFSSIQTKLS